MVQAADNPKPAEKPLEGLPIPPERQTDPLAWSEAALKLINTAQTEKKEALACKRQLDILADWCPRFTGLNIEDISRERMDPIAKFRGLMEANGKELDELEAAVATIDRLRASEEEKKRWIDMIRRTRALQAQCRPDPVKSWTYIGRDSEKGEIFTMAPHHLEYFKVWNGPEANSLIMAPPGHAKTTSMRGQVVFEIGQNPCLRCLLLYDTRDKARKEVGLLRIILRSGRFRALYPEVRVLGRVDEKESSTLRFTVVRPNEFSREPTIEGASILGRINGNGYDRIFGDDVCPEGVRRHTCTRRDINETWVSVVEERVRGERPRIRLIATPWHEQDVTGVIMRQVEQGEMKDWKIAVDQFRIKDDAAGRPIPIWNRFSSEYLSSKRARMGSSYDLVYRLRPRGSDKQLVNKVQFYNTDLGTSPPGNHQADSMLLDSLSQGERWLSIDPSASGGSQACDTGMIEAVISPGGYAFIADAHFMHEGAVWMRDWIVNTIYNARPRYAGIQIEAQGGLKGQANLWLDDIIKALESGRIPELDPDGKEWRIVQRDPMKERPIVITTGTRMGNQDGETGQNLSKIHRLSECAPFIEHGFVKFAGRRWSRSIKSLVKRGFEAVPNSQIAELVSHVLDFEASPRKDGVDALTQWILRNGSRLKDPEIVRAPRLVQPKQNWMTNLLNKQMAEMEAAHEKRPAREEEREFLYARYGERRSA